MKCHFCDATGVKIDLIKYGSKTLPVCMSCSYLDNIKGDEEAN